MKKRLFIAVDISAEARAQATAYVKELGTLTTSARVSWTKPENLHLTLKFLGDVDLSKVEVVIEALDHSPFGVPPFGLSLARTGVFPMPRKPKVLWLGVDDIERRLETSANIIDSLLSDVGFAKEDRAFSPHLTIGRIRDSREGREIAKMHSTRRFGPIRFAVDEIVLYHSQLSASGSVYTPIFKKKLAG